MINPARQDDADQAVHGIGRLSLPSLVMLYKVVKARLPGLIVGIIVSGIMLIGWLFDSFGSLLV